MALRMRPGMSDRAIAEHCGVHHDTVGEHRKRLSESDSQPGTRTGLDGRNIDTTNIGRRPAPGNESETAVLEASTGDEQQTAVAPMPSPQVLTDEELLARDGVRTDDLSDEEDLKRLAQELSRRAEEQVRLEKQLLARCDQLEMDMKARSAEVADLITRAKSLPGNRYCCPTCQMVAWAKPDAHLMCEGCGEQMRPEEPRPRKTSQE
jgi:hypothetical protein